MVYKRSITTHIVFLLRHNGVQEVNNNKYCIPPQTQWCTRGQYKTNIFDWQLMVSKTDFIYTHTNHVNLKNIIRIRSWKQSVYIWHINQNIWEVDTSFKRVFCFVFRGPHFVSVIHCLLSSSTFHIWIISSETLLFCWNDICGVLYKRNYSFYFDLAKNMAAMSISCVWLT